MGDIGQIESNDGSGPLNSTGDLHIRTSDSTAKFDMRHGAVASDTQH